MMRFRNIFAGLLLVSSVFAAPPLTTIQDVLYKADGTRFNGTLTITWNSFQAMDSSTIVTQSTTVKILDGNLRVQLVPTTTGTPATYYQVTYNSDGRIQFQETWSVPSSQQPLRLRDVRVTSATQAGTSSADTTGTTSVQESDVVGLIADLSARPLKGAAYAANRVALVNAAGAIESVTGDDSDCVRVDGTAGPCGAQAPSFVDADIPSGVVDGANPTFSLTALPNPISSLALYRNGLLQKASSDFTISGRTVQFLSGAVPQPGDTLLASYRLSDTAPTQSIYPQAQVLCSGAGAATNSASWSTLGTCSIPAGTLVPGDRIEVRFDYAHAGTASGFSFEVHWGATTLLHRDAASADVLATGRADASVSVAGAQLSAQSWGTVLPLTAAVVSSSDTWSGGLTINFVGEVGQSNDTLTLVNFAVVRLP